ncbi:MAG: cytochrome C oxidase subunit IV family protein [Panacagrimonas sp.]
MLALLQVPIHRSWLLLLIATAITFWLRADGFVGITAAAGTLLIAYLKGRLVVLDFMELREAPLIWRRIFEGWLLVVSAAILAVYWFGSLSA